MGTCEVLEVTLAEVFAARGEVFTEVPGDKQADIEVGRTFIVSTISEEITTWYGQLPCRGGLG